MHDKIKKSSKPHLDILGIPICDTEFCTSYISSNHAVARCILSGLEEVDTIDSQEGFALLTQGKALKNLTIIFPAILSELAGVAAFAAEARSSTQMVPNARSWAGPAFHWQLASHLTIHLSSPKSTIVAEIYTIAAQICKHGLNDERCRDVEVCIPLVVETYRCWGTEAIQALSRLATHLSMRQGHPKSLVCNEMYERLSPHESKFLSHPVPLSVNCACYRCRNCESQSTSVDMTDLSWKQAQLSLSKGGLGPRSLMLRAPAAYIASVCSSEYSHQSHTHLVHAVEIFNLCVAPSEKISLDPLSSPMQQKALFSKLDDLQFHALFNVSSVADRALVLSISAPHSSSWLSVVPSEDLGLKLNQISAMLLSNGRLA
ncbi:hypothetical protein EMCRGX_G020708 [Ephydatia muelleri]